MATVTATPAYAAAVTITWTSMVSASSDGSLINGFGSLAVDNSAADTIDSLVGGIIYTGTSPTASRQIEIWAYANIDATNYSGGCTGTDAANSLTAENKTMLRLLTIIPTNSTTSAKYTWGPFSIAQAFGGVVPVKWGLWGVHNTGVPLQAGVSAAYIPVKFESA